MRGLKRHRSARILGAGHAFAQNLRRGHHDIATDAPSRHLLRATFDNLAIIIRPAKISNDHALTLCAMGQRNNAHRNWLCVARVRHVPQSLQFRRGFARGPLRPGLAAVLGR